MIINKKKLLPLPLCQLFHICVSLVSSHDVVNASIWGMSFGTYQASISSGTLGITERALSCEPEDRAVGLALTQVSV